MALVLDALWNVYKFLLHTVTGTCEIERILAAGASPEDPATVLRMAAALRRSKTLTGVCKTVLDSNGEFDAETEAVSVGITKGHAIDGLTPALERLGNVNRLCQLLSTRYRTAFDSGNAQHEADLEELWTRMTQGKERTGGRYTSEWGEIGFQGKDPATDFRGMGLLGLDCMVHFARAHATEAQRTMKQAHGPYEYSWAIVGINLCGWCVELVERRRMVAPFVRASPTDDDAALVLRFFDLFARVFADFSQFWVDSKPENIMAFSQVFADFKDKMLREQGDATLL